MSELTQERLKSLLHYDPETGSFVRAKNCGKGAMAGDIAGWVNQHGYRIIKIKSKAYKAHRLAFLYMTGALPVQQVDHLNGLPGDNRWLNLRETDNAGNAKNQKLPKNNTSGMVGLRPAYDFKKWRAYISVNGQRINLGTHKTWIQAALARKRAEIKYGYSRLHGISRNPIHNKTTIENIGAKP